MKKTRRRIDVNLVELDQVLDSALQAPLSEADHDKLKETLHALAALLMRSRNTEKTSEVVEKPEDSEAEAQQDNNAPPPPGHGRNGAEAFGGAQKVDIKHQKLSHGDRCPECRRGNVYGQKEPKVLVRIIGQAPLHPSDEVGAGVHFRVGASLGTPVLAATVYSLERLRCGACGQVFTAQEPEGVGPEKYDETAAAMIAQLKYGTGTPFYRLEQLEGQLGIPLPAATQREIAEEVAQMIKPARDELIRQAALHRGKGLEARDFTSQLCSLQNYAQSGSGVGPSTLNRPDLSGRPGFREGLQSWPTAHNQSVSRK